MSGALLVGLWLVVNAAELPSTASAPALETTPRKSLIEVGGGVAVATKSLRIGAGFEQPLFVSRTFFVVSTLRADWRHFSSRYPAGAFSLDTIDAQAGMRLGRRWATCSSSSWALGLAPRTPGQETRRRFAAGG